jgi:hypothetical protein
VTVPLQDHWAGLNHKAVMRGEFTGDIPLPPTWVPPDDQRRLRAYSVLGAYLNNNSNVYVRAAEDVKANRREYGDSELLVSQVSSSIVGRGARIAVEGAERPPEEPPEGASASEVSRFQRIKAQYPRIVERQEEMDAWAKKEEWPLRVAEEENLCLGLGDGVYWLTWSTEQRRVLARVMDPGFYFPVYGPRDDGKSFPKKVHLAWEYEDHTDRQHPRKFVRRITYEMRRLEEMGLAPKRYAYQEAGEDASPWTCLMTDLTWDLSDVRTDIADLSLSAAMVEVNEDGLPIFELDLGIDFIPIVHVPNTGTQPWGTSILTRIAQVIDDLQVADTDSADAASVAGGPPIAVAGATTSDTYTSYGPKTVWELPSGGGASVLDTSKGLESLQTHSDRLFDRAVTNAQVPREILGKVAANEVPSGLALALSFGPFEVLIERERQVRSFKYELLLKMVQRMHIVGGEWEAPVFPAGVTFGSALPSDIQALTGILMKLVNNRPILSRVTAARMLAEQGFPIPDIATEADRVQAEDFEGAALLYRGMRAPQMAAEYLGMELPEDVLMEALGRLLKRDISLDEVRDLFDEQKAREEELKIAEAEKTAAEANARKDASAQMRASGGTVSGNQPPGRGRQPAPKKPDAKQ